MSIDKFKHITNEAIRHSMRQSDLRNEAHLEGERQALIKLNKEYFTDYYRQNPEEIIGTLLNEKHRTAMVEYFKDRKGKGRYKYLFVGINPFTDVTYQELIRLYNKYKNKKWIEKIESCIEWTTGESNTDGKFHNGNMHIHSKIWLDPKKDPYRCRREIYNTFKGVLEYNNVQVEFGNREGSFDQYIRGYKLGKIKPCMEVTTIYRKHYKAKDII